MTRLDSSSGWRLAPVAAVLVGTLLLVGAWSTRRRADSERSERESTIYDAGAVFAEDRPVIKHSFQVRNTSDRTIRLTDQLCACTCTTTKLHPAVLEPGQAGTLDMSMVMTDAYADKTVMSCELRFDDGTAREYSLVYRLYPRIMADREFLDFGTFSEDERRPGSSLDLDIYLFAPPGERLASLRSIEAPEEFEVEQVGSTATTTTTENGVQRRHHAIRVKPRPGVQLAGGGGTFTKSIRFVADDGSTATTNLLWRQHERFRCSPSPISFGVVDPGGSAATRQAIITASLGEGFRAESVESDSPHLKAAREAGSREQASGAVERIELSLMVPADYPRDVVSGVVEARMTDDRRSTVLIPWSAIVRRPRATEAAASGQPLSD